MTQKTLTSSTLAVSCATPVVFHLPEIPEYALLSWVTHKYLIAQLDICVWNVFTIWNKKMEIHWCRWVEFLHFDRSNLIGLYYDRLIKAEWIILSRHVNIITCKQLIPESPLCTRIYGESVRPPLAPIAASWFWKVWLRHWTSLNCPCYTSEEVHPYSTVELLQLLKRWVNCIG